MKLSVKGLTLAGAIAWALGMLSSRNLEHHVLGVWW
jgi:hypothetical protein